MNAIWALALSAGAIAALNPCAFGLLPAYLAVFVRASANEARLPRRIVRALLTSCSLTMGFMLVFFAAGVAFEGAGSTIQRRLPFVTLTVGIVVIALGIASLAGRTFRSPKLAQGTRHRSATVPAMIGFGATFATASFSCTVGPFLAVVAVANSQSFVTSLGAYAAYAVGMGTVVTLLALSAALVGHAPRRFRMMSRFSPQLEGAVMILSGTYAVWYARWELRVYGGDVRRDRLIVLIDAWRNNVASTVDANLALLITAVVGIAGVSAATLAFSRSDEHDPAA